LALELRMNQKSISLIPIGIVRSSRQKTVDDNWDAERVHVELDSNLFTSEALAGISDFSHSEIVFFMDQVDPSKIEKSAWHPRNNAEWPKVGIFAQRGKNRPNQIGLTICRFADRIGSRRIQLSYRLDQFFSC